SGEWEDCMRYAWQTMVRLGCILIATALITGTALAQEPLKIRIGWSTMPGHMIPVLYSKPEILKYYGKSYTVEPILFRGSTPQLTAMAARGNHQGAVPPPPPPPPPAQTAPAATARAPTPPRRRSLPVA